MSPKSCYLPRALPRGDLCRRPKRAVSASQVARGEIDFSLNFITPLILAIDQGERLTVLGGVHPGCFELFVKEGITSVVEPATNY